MKFKKLIRSISAPHKSEISADESSTDSTSFPIVGIGTSAGGLETFTQLLHELPSDTGMAFVLIQHLDPKHSSILSEILSKATQMPVLEISDGKKVEPNHVYVIPPGCDVGILHGKLSLFHREKSSRPHMAIDFFFHALADDCGSHAVGVVLTGTGSDGTSGLGAIKAENGVTLVQDPKEAKFDGMPQSAVNAEVVDFCLPIPQLARELLRLSRHPYILGRLQDPLSDPHDVSDLQKIFVLLRTAKGIDFSEYKPSTIKRRLARRMALLKIDDLKDYLKLLQQTPEESELLTADVLINVTSFFRDPEVFKELQNTVFPEILKHKAVGSPFRIWVAGCSSGEEVYSIAISLLEFLGDRSSSFPIQVFGSDIGEQMIVKARKGFYSDSALRDVNPERLKRYFVKVEGGYRINPLVRGLCVFVRHDLAKDPPFSKLDLVTCRNVLIYFEQALQKRIISTFHYCLNPRGILLLGGTEGISGNETFFSAVDKKHRIFLRESITSRLSFATMQNTPTQKQAFHAVPVGLEGSSNVAVSKQVDSLLLSHYAPAGVIVNERMEIIQYRGRTGLYLEPPPGQPQLNVLKMVREGLFAPLKMALDEVKKKMTVVRRLGIVFKQNGISRTCNISAIPLSKLPSSKEPLFLVTFEEVPLPSEPVRGGKKSAPPNSAALSAESEAQRAAELEHELRGTQEYLQSLNEDHQKTNDTLNSLNEELISGNEELQSMNEELETAKEELQSTNEELTTVNDELQSRNQETALINDDLINLLNSSDIPILILDLNRRIRRFTPKARAIMNLLPTDVGRQIDDIKLNINVEHLDQQLQDVVDTVTMKESEVQDRGGRWHRLQIRPYKTVDNRIAGTVLSLVDIDKLRELLTEAQEAKSEADKANLAKDLFLATLSHELRTPLTSLTLQAQMLKRGNFDDPRVIKASIAIESAALTQAQLIEDLLDVSRIVTGKLKIELKPVDIDKVVLAALDTVSAVAESKSVKIESHVDNSVGQISGDPVRLQQIVWNLLTNAIKFSTKGEKVTVNLKTVDGQAQIQVIDTGVGITPEFLPRVFNRFSQAEAAITRSHGGLGLGLAIVRHLVELHDGTVKVESPGKNKGATFTVTLPLMKAMSEASKREKKLKSKTEDFFKKSGKPEKLDGISILLVEDDLGTREALFEFLGQTGAQVKVAASASEAMQLLKGFTPDIMVLDVSMPGEDGYSLLRRIRKLEPPGKKVPAVALTALASEKDREAAFSAGFQMHLTKPVDIERLTRALQQLQEQRKLIH